MAKNVTAQQLGGQPKTFAEIDSLQDIMDEFDLESPSIKVNGNTVDADYEIQDYDFISFGEKVKGGR